MGEEEVGRGQESAVSERKETLTFIVERSLAFHLAVSKSANHQNCPKGL